MESASVVLDVFFRAVLNVRGLRSQVGGETHDKKNVLSLLVVGGVSVMLLGSNVMSYVTTDLPPVKSINACERIFAGRSPERIFSDASETFLS